MKTAHKKNINVQPFYNDALLHFIVLQLASGQIVATKNIHVKKWFFQNIDTQ